MTFKVQDILNLFSTSAFSGDANVEVRSVQIDSRKIGKNDVFVAIKGERVDGHDFIEAALQQGAALCLTERPSNHTKTVMGGNSTLALAKLAKWYRQQLQGAVIGITGSSGKTTTKQLLHHVLSQVGMTQSTEGNLNNHLGVPLTLLNFKSKADFSIVEMGMSAAGEIRDLCHIAKPNIGLITSVGAAHIQNFDGKIENIAKAKGELFESLTANDIAIVNNDDALICNLPTQAKRITFGVDQNANVRAENVFTDEFATHFVIVYQDQNYTVQLPLFGKHHVQNALGVFAVACALNLNLATIAKAFSSFEPFKGRGQFIEFAAGTIMDDTYNANPSSMQAAFDTLKIKYADHYKIAVLGDMFELGETASHWHTQVGVAAKKAGINQMYTLGNESVNYSIGFGHSVTEQTSQHFSTHQELANALFQNTKGKQKIAVLFKGSRGMKMEIAMQSYLDLWSGQ